MTLIFLLLLSKEVFILFSALYSGIVVTQGGDMVRLTFLNGVNAGLVIPFSLDDVFGNPNLVMTRLVSTDLLWELDVDEASADEAELWIVSDLATRITRAIERGRQVVIGEQTFQVATPTDVAEVARVTAEVDNTMASCCREFWIEREDEAGVVIGLGDLLAVAQS